jgi:diaminopimelate decarboxylase
MDLFNYKNGELYCDEVKISDIAAKAGTPVYVYSEKTLVGHFNKIAKAYKELDPIICYSIKSCQNLHLLKALAAAGAGMDVVSGGELFRAQKAGVNTKKIVYAGVGKTDKEIAEAIKAGIGWFNIESEAEFENISKIAKSLNAKANAALRVNPDVADPKTHAKTTTGKKETKFGVDIERARKFFDTYGKDPHLSLNAIHLHIGSPIYSAEPYVLAIKKALELIAELKTKGYTVTALDIGGGYAADYITGKSPTAEAYAAEIVPLLRDFKKGGGTIILEPGRTIAANAGALIAQVQYIKMGGSKKFVILDTGMHHLIRPTLYESFHFIWPVNIKAEHTPEKREEQMEAKLQGLEKVDVVGPICESGDFLAKDRYMPPVQRGDLVCIFTAGAYGMVMASNYNTMPRPPEVLVSGTTVTLIRRRESYEDLVAAEAQSQTL